MLEPDGQEVRESGAVVVQDPERAVAGGGHRAGLLDEVVEENRELEISLEQQRRFEHPPELGGVLDRPERHRSSVAGCP